MWCIDIQVSKTLTQIKLNFKKRREEMLEKENSVVLDLSLNRVMLCTPGWP